MKGTPVMLRVRAVHPEWLSEKKVTVLVQYALKRHSELPDIRRFSCRCHFA
jgi:hypothetical protein